MSTRVPERLLEISNANSGGSASSHLSAARFEIRDPLLSSASNSFLNRVQVVPLTSSTDRLYPSEALVKVRGRSSKAMADQLTTASKQRLLSKAGEVSAAEMAAVEQAIRTQLALI